MKGMSEIMLATLMAMTNSQNPESVSLSEIWCGEWPQSMEAFEQFVETFKDRLVQFAFRRLGNFHDAEDVVQKVFTKAFSERERYQKITYVGPYLYRMASNACQDFHRKHHRRKEVSFEASHVEIRSNESMLPTNLVMASEEMYRIEQVLQRLPKRQAEVIRYRIFDELSFAEIAQAIGCFEGTVKSRFRYGLKKLKKIVAQQWEVSL